MKYILFALSLSMPVLAVAQNTDSAAKYQFVQQMPKAPYDFMKYLQDNIHYPDAARQDNITGRVVIRFVVMEDGSITQLKVIRGIGGGCDEEALRVIGSMPRWIAGRQDGRPVKVQYTQAVTFTLTGTSDKKKADATGNTTFS